MVKTYGEGLVEEAVSAFKEGYSFLDSKLPLDSVLLAISGVESKPEMIIYSTKLLDIGNDLRTKFKINGRNGEVQKTASALLDHLQKRKERRYKRAFKLTDAIDAYEDPNPTTGIGNCLGLTAFYSSLARKLGMDLNLLLESKHVLARVDYFGRDIPVDLTIDKAFLKDFPSRLAYYNKRRYYDGEQMLPDEQKVENFFKNRFSPIALRYLIPQFINSRGVEKLVQGNQGEAVADFCLAADIDPRFAAPHTNLGAIHYSNGRRDLAEEEFGRALILNPKSDIVHVNLGALYLSRALRSKDFGDKEAAERELFKAKRYIDEALELDVFNAEAYHYDSLLKDSLGDENGAAHSWQLYERYKKPDSCGHDDSPFPSKRRIGVQSPTDLCKRDMKRKINDGISGVREFILVNMPPKFYKIGTAVKGFCGKFCIHNH
jgi:tetratricopeptide (TPR) repeat protein